MAHPSRRLRSKGCCARPGLGPRRKVSCSGPSAGPSLPEGDTIWRTAAALRGRIEGKVATDARPAASARLTGRRGEVAAPDGKHLLKRFRGGTTAHSHRPLTG